MPKPAQNTLTLTPLADGRFKLAGYLNGKQHRYTGTDAAALEKKKADLEHEANEAIRLLLSAPKLQHTRLTEKQIQEAEALFAEFKAHPRSIAEYARAGLTVLGVAELTLCADALTNWLNWQRDERNRDEGTTIANNRQELTRFFEEAKVKYVSDITNAAIENYCSLSNITALTGKKASVYSKLTRASRIRAFLNYCVKKKILAKSPFEMDMEEVREDARHGKGKTVIFTPTEAIALMDAAIEHDPRYIPFVLLSGWCFMRKSEVVRCTPEQVQLDRPVPFVEPESAKFRTASYRTTNIPTNMVPLLREVIEAGIWKKGETPFFADVSFQILREKAGLLKLSEPNAKGARKVVSGKWQKNILRHTGISMFYQQLSEKADKGTFNEKSAIAALTRQAGNSEEVAFAHYINIADAAQAAEFFAYAPRLKKTVAQSNEQAVA